jgi:myo-inositol-1(or 4)-monophosphatase
MIIVTLNSILPHVVKTAKKAGAFIKKERENFSPAKVEVKGLNDLVSYVDRGSEKIIVDDLKDILPEAGFIVEENSVEGKKEYNWIVDPLDGTTNFVHGIPCYAVSIALEHNGEIILGVVYEVSRNECFTAVKGGKGAFMNNNPIRVSENDKLSKSLIATGFPIHNFQQLDNYMNALKFLMQKTHGVRRIGAASIDLCYLACGRVDAFFEYNLSPWDVAAGSLIIEEAGGTVTDFKGGNNFLFGKEIMGTNGLVMHEFEEAIQMHFL